MEKTQVQFSPNWYELGPPILYAFGRYYKALQPLLLALFTQTIYQRNIRRSVSQGKNDRTGRDCIVNNHYEL